MYPQSNKRFRLISGYRIEPFSETDLKLLGEGMTTFGVDRIRFTPGSQLSVSGLNDEQVDSFTRFILPLLKPLPDNGISAIFSCNECADCRNRMVDTNIIIEELTRMTLPQPMPAKVKVAVAGCVRCCTMPRMRDVGFIPASAETSGWNVFFGGNGGRKPRVGDRIGTGLSVDESIKLACQALTLYQKIARDKMRTSTFLSELTLKEFLKMVKKIDQLTQVKGNKPGSDII